MAARKIRIGYKRFPGAEQGTCFYCGMPADTVDHVPPVSLVDSLVGLERLLPRWVVPACHECNSTLGDEPLFKLSERAAFLIEKYEKLYHNYLSCGDFSDDELSELGPILRSQVENAVAVKRVITRRLQSLMCLADE